MKRLCLAIVSLVLAACGDWPWPEDNPKDPLRCGTCDSPYSCIDGKCVFDPCRYEKCSEHGTCTATENSFICTCNTGFAGDKCEVCGAGYKDYPACSKDFCFDPNACNGHGTCSNNACVCNKGYAGSACERCATGYTGYPTCGCECKTKGQTCDGTSLKTCDGCSYTTKSCTSVCGSKKVSACGYDPTNKYDVCWCTAYGHDALIWTFTNNASNTQPVYVEIYDNTSSNAILAAVQTLPYGTAKSFAVDCVTGHNICYGAWVAKVSYGCGAGCKTTCSNCCSKCGSTLSTGNIPLN